MGCIRQARYHQATKSLSRPSGRMIPNNSHRAASQAVTLAHCILHAVLQSNIFCTIFDSSNRHIVSYVVVAQVEKLIPVYAMFFRFACLPLNPISSVPSISRCGNDCLILRFDIEYSSGASYLILVIEYCTLSVSLRPLSTSFHPRSNHEPSEHPDRIDTTTRKPDTANEVIFGHESSVQAVDLCPTNDSILLSARCVMGFSCMEYEDLILPWCEKARGGHAFVIIVY